MNEKEEVINGNVDDLTYFRSESRSLRGFRLQEREGMKAVEVKDLLQH